MFRNATMADLDQVAAIYDRIHTEEEAGRSTVGWIRGVYPTRQTALASIQAGDLFVAEEDGQIVATAKINQEQVPVYASAAWSREAKPQEVMVLHTLVVDPQVKGKGWGSRFVAFYEDYARDHGCRDLRMDTNERNAAARRLYHNLGYQEVSILPCEFNGIPGVTLVCREKLLEPTWLQTALCSPRAQIRPGFGRGCSFFSGTYPIGPSNRSRATGVSNSSATFSWSRVWARAHMSLA